MRSQVQWVWLALIGLCVNCSSVRAESWLTDEEVQVLRQTTSFHRSGKNNVMPSDLDAIQLDAFATKGSESLRPLARYQLMAHALAVLQQDKKSITTWKVAEAEGQPQLFDVWFSEVARELPKYEFPFSTKDLSKLRPVSNDLVTNWQIDGLMSIRFRGMYVALGNTKLKLLKDGLKARAEERKLPQVDPVVDQTLLCEVTPESSGNFFATMNKLTNRGMKDLVNVVVIQHLDVDAPEIKLHPNYGLLAGTNSIVNGVTGIGNARSQNDQGAAIQLTEQWLESNDAWVLNYIPRLKPRESVLLPITSSGPMQYGRRLQAAVGCDSFWIDSLPVTKLADSQKKEVQVQLKRGSTWSNGEKPHVVADEKFEKDFLKARADAAKAKSGK